MSATRVKTPARAALIAPLSLHRSAERVDDLKSNGRGKVLFSTNDPMIMPAKVMESPETRGLADETKALFLSGITQKVYGI